MTSKKIKNCWELKLERTQWKQTFHGKKIENKQYPKDYHLQKKKIIILQWDYHPFFLLYFLFKIFTNFISVNCILLTFPDLWSGILKLKAALVLGKISLKITFVDTC